MLTGLLPVSDSLLLPDLVLVLLLLQQGLRLGLGQALLLLLLLLQRAVKPQ